MALLEEVWRCDQLADLIQALVAANVNVTQELQNNMIGKTSKMRRVKRPRQSDRVTELVTQMPRAGGPVVACGRNSRGVAPRGRKGRRAG